MLKRVETSGNTCPCCGQAVLWDPDLWVSLDMNSVHRHGVVVHLSPNEAVILRGLQKMWPGPFSHDRCMQALYGNAKHEPEAPAIVLKVLISGLRKKLKALGVGIRNVYGTGYRLDVAP